MELRETPFLGPCTALWPKQLGFDLAVTEGNSGLPTPTLSGTIVGLVSRFMVKSQDHLQCLQEVEVWCGKASHAGKVGVQDRADE